MNIERIKNSILCANTSLGIELGSTRIKGILVDENNEVIASGGYRGRISSKTAFGHIISTMFGRVCANATEPLPRM